VRLVVGQVVRAHGIRGEVLVHPTTDQPRLRFTVGAEVLTPDGAVLTVRSARAHGGRWLVRFVGVDDRTRAESLARLALSVEVDDDARGEDPDEFYDAQLVGLQARLADGSVVGTVSAVEHGPAQDRLVLDLVARPGTAVRVPFVVALVPEVRADEGWLAVDLPPGLDELEPGA
jgi:16S rRNA processing protein RimM